MICVVLARLAPDLPKLLAPDLAILEAPVSVKVGKGEKEVADRPPE